MVCRIILFLGIVFISRVLFRMVGWMIVSGGLMERRGSGTFCYYKCDLI